MAEDVSYLSSQSIGKWIKLELSQEVPYIKKWILKENPEKRFEYKIKLQFAINCNCQGGASSNMK